MYLIAFLLISYLLPIIGNLEADPSYQDNNDGTATSSWSFQNSSNYTVQNVSTSPGSVVLETRTFQLIDTSSADFQQGSVILNVNVTSDPGNITLRDTTSAGLPSFLELPIDQMNGTDALINANNVNRNYGAALTLNMNLNPEERTLVKFDTRPFQYLDLITSSGLILKLQSASSALPLNVSAHQVLASWVEGNQTGVGGPADGTTWRTRDGTNLWTTIGGDYNPVSEDIVFDIQDQTNWYRWDITNLTRYWINGTQPNFGVMLIPVGFPLLNEEKRFHSSESGPAGNRPRVRVDYISHEGGMANGTFISRALDAGSVANWGNISWSSLVTNRTNMSIQSRSGDCLGNWSQWSASYANPAGSQITSPQDRCIQYKAEMTTYNRTQTPVLEEVRIEFQRYVPEGSVETQDLAPINWVNWEDFGASYFSPPDANISFWYSTDAGGNWTEVFEGENLNGVISPVMRFKANLTAWNTSVTPILYEMNITYQFFGNLDHIHMSMATWSGTSDEWIDLDATGHDAFEHAVAYTQKWETDDPWGSVDILGVYDPGMVGTWSVYCNNTDDSISNYTTVSVLPGMVSRIEVDPWDPGTVSTDDMLFFNATAFDLAGNFLGPVAVNWTTAGGIGTVSSGPSSSATFDPTTPGVGTVTANDGLGHTNTTNTIIVVVGARDRVGIEPWSPGTITTDDILNFTALSYDADGNQIGPTSVTWMTSGGIGTIPPGPSSTATFDATTVGIGNVDIDDGQGHTNVTDVITVVEGALDFIVLSPPSIILRTGEYFNFTAIGYDANGNVVDLVSPLWETTAGVITASSATGATLKAVDTELSGGWIRVTAVLQNNVSSTSSVDVVVLNVRPTIVGEIPSQTRLEDYGSWSLDLTAFASDPQDPLSNLTWFFTKHDPSLTTITGDGIYGNHFITFTTQPNAFGSDELNIWLRDTDGNSASQTMWINLTPVNDRPIIQSITPFTLHFDTPYTYFFYDYVSDIETSRENLTLTSDDSDHISFDGLWGTFIYPESYNGQTVYPIIKVQDEAGDEMSTILAITVSDDYVPVLINELPDVFIMEGEEIPNYFDLDDYFTDPDEDSLFYTYGSVHTQITINDDHSVDFKAPDDWSGVETVTFRAVDPANARAEDIVLITVLPINDPPTISGVPDLSVRYYDTANPSYNYTFDLAPYIYDEDNETSELVVYTNDPTYIFFSGTSNTVMLIHYPQSHNGQTVSVRIHVFDGISEDYQDITVTVMSDWPPETAMQIPDYDFHEDTELLDKFMLTDYFTDSDGDDLTFTSFSKNISISIDEVTTYVSFGSPPNWYGWEYVTFRATDPQGAIAEQTIKVTVLPVNDAPEILTIPELTVNMSQTYTFDLAPYVFDIDNEIGELTFLAVSNSSKMVVSIAGSFVVLQYYQEGNDVILVEVSDGNLTTHAYISVRIVGPPPPSILDQMYWPWSFIIAFLASLLLFAWLRGRYAKIFIEEAFLIHGSGNLIHHTGIGRHTDIDEDIFSNMLTAIQEFIKDSFKKIEDSPVKRIEFGERKIMLERGKKLYLAVVYVGHETVRNVQPLVDAIEEIEKKYEKELMDWDGMMISFAGVEEILHKHLGESQKRSRGHKLTHQKEGANED
jgi:hypothetical protein